MQHNFVPATAINFADKSLANIHETQVAQFCLEADYVESTSEVSLWGPGDVCCRRSTFICSHRRHRIENERLLMRDRKGRSPGDQSLSCFRSTHDRFAARHDTPA